MTKYRNFIEESNPTYLKASNSNSTSTRNKRRQEIYEKNVTLRRADVTIVATEKNKSYIF
jgi:hypothetical protein